MYTTVNNKLTKFDVTFTNNGLELRAVRNVVVDKIRKYFSGHCKTFTWVNYVFKFIIDSIRSARIKQKNTTIIFNTKNDKASQSCNLNCILAFFVSYGFPFNVVKIRWHEEILIHSGLRYLSKMSFISVYFKLTVPKTSIFCLHKCLNAS